MFLTIIFVQALIVNAALIPFEAFTWIGNMFSCVPFGIRGWITIVVLALTMIPVDMVRKLVVKQKVRTCAVYKKGCREMQFAHNLLSNWQYFAAALLYFLFLAGIVECVLGK